MQHVIVLVVVFLIANLVYGAEYIAPVFELPDPDAWTYEEKYGVPDIIVSSPAVDIPANGTDLWAKHITRVGNTRDRAIRAIQVKPRGDAKSVVHHANSSILVDGERFGMLTEYAMGKIGEEVPVDVYRKLPANAEVLWDIHMFPGGVGAGAEGLAVLDNVVEVAIWLVDDDEAAALEYEQDLSLYQISQQSDIVIPPNGYLITQGFHSFDHPVRLDSWQPHGHLRMVAASIEIFYPETGKLEAISQVSNWSATWHHSHKYGATVAPLIPAGAVIVMRQWYDNTADNINNPDPDQWVLGGSRTGDEMTHAWLAVTHLDEDGFDSMTAERI